MRKIGENKWKALEKLLNSVANERQEDSDGPGSSPTANANSARAMLADFGMERRV